VNDCLAVRLNSTDCVDLVHDDEADGSVMSTVEVAAKAAPDGASYFPAIIIAVFDSPLDALVALTVPRDEALDIVVASWPVLARCAAGNALAAKVEEGNVGSADAPAIVAHIQGGRCVAVLPTAAGRWAACNAFLDPPCHTRVDAERLLARLLRGRRVGCIGRLPQSSG
jgi:hypothetical protein